MGLKFFQLNKVNKIWLLIVLLIIISLHHLFPIFFVGKTIIYTNDILNYFIPNNFIAGKILSGEIDTADLFLNGELPWHFVYGVFYPINILYNFFEIETAYLTTDLFIRLIGFLSFFYFLKRSKADFFLKILISALFSSQLITTVWGLGVATFPYLLSLCLRDKHLKLRHIFALVIIGLNTDLYLHGIYIYLIIFFSVIFFKKKIAFIKKKNFYIPILIFTFFLFVSNSNLIYNIIYFSPFQLSERIINYNFNESLFNFLQIILIPKPVNNYFFLNFFLISIFWFSIYYTFLKKVSSNIELLKLIFFLVFVIFLINLIGVFKIIPFLNGILLNRIGYFLIFFQLLIIFNTLNNIQRKEVSFLIIFFSLIYNQLTPSFFTVIKNHVGFDYFSANEKEILKKNYNNFEIFNFYENLKRFKGDQTQEDYVPIKSYFASTFHDYYRFGDIKSLKSKINNNRVFSIGFDPMVFVVNDIRVTGGYYRYYPLDYKYKYLEIVKDQIDYQAKKNKKDLDDEIFNFRNSGQFLQSFYKKGDEFKINLNKLKEMNISYIVSKYELKSKSLKKICEKCEEINDINLYYIK
tara:strand:- start:1077 stop:2813 length:1737 start_codon:yes stop_codon:yes gene_type:complete